MHNPWYAHRRVVIMGDSTMRQLYSHLIVADARSDSRVVPFSWQPTENILSKLSALDGSAWHVRQLGCNASLGYGCVDCDVSPSHEMYCRSDHMDMAAYNAELNCTIEFSWKPNLYRPRADNTAFHRRYQRAPTARRAGCRQGPTRRELRVPQPRSQGPRGHGSFGRPVRELQRGAHPRLPLAGRSARPPRHDHRLPHASAFRHPGRGLAYWRRRARCNWDSSGRTRTSTASAQRIVRRQVASGSTTTTTTTQCSSKSSHRSRCTWKTRSMIVDAQPLASTLPKGFP